MTFNINSNGQDSLRNNIFFLQGDSAFVIESNTDSVYLERKAFSLRYFCKQYDEKNKKFYSAQIAILDNPNDTISLQIGQNTKDISYFEPGTGMAPGENGRYDTIYISNSGHHYLTYESEAEKRVDKISSIKDILQLEWKISAANYQENDMQFENLDLPFLYFIIYIDNNLNEKIDEGEMKIVKVIFK